MPTDWIGWPPVSGNAPVENRLLARRQRDGLSSMSPNAVRPAVDKRA